MEWKSHGGRKIQQDQIRPFSRKLSQEVMPVGNLTPSKRPRASVEESSMKKVSSQEEWISSVLMKAALRPQLRSLPVIWMIVVSAIIFPIGLWNQMDSVGVAEESKAIATDSETGSRLRVLPFLPSPTLLAAAIPGKTRNMRLRVIETGTIDEREVELPENATVKDVLHAFGIGLTALDRTFPALNDPVYHGQSIRVTRVRTEEKTRTIEVAPSVRYRPTSAIPAGQQKTENAGVAGTVEVSERVWFKDGAVSGREVLARKTIREPQDKVVAIGARAHYLPGKIPYHNRYAKAYSLAARAGSPRDRVMSHETQTLRPVRSMVLTATGYSPDPRENGGYTVTATGLPISYGAAATDPRVIPLGTKLYIEGYGYAFACDVGGAIKGNRIDLAYDSYREANTKGRKKVRVWILAP